MRCPSIFKSAILFFCLFSFITSINAQTKEIKRPKTKVGISSVDIFVSESFDLYDKVYKYDGYVQSKTPLDDSDIDVLEDALEDVTLLSNNALNILDDLGGQSVLKQGKATLQINRAKKALKYSIKTAKQLLLGHRNQQEEEQEEKNDKKDVSTKESTDNNESISQEKENSNVSDNLEVYSKFDYVPGNKLLFYDDFSNDFVGDFPSKWNTNGSGEIVKINKVSGNWLKLKSGYNIMVIPDLKTLPEDYTIEFDIIAQGIDKKTSSAAGLHLILSDTDKFTKGDEHYVEVTIPFGQYGNLKAKNHFNRSRGDINSNIKVNVHNAILNKPHISISVTKKRYRLWLNQKKYVDIPRFIQELNVLNYIKFHIYSFKDEKENVFISNLKVAEGGIDLRRKLLTEGKISTNGILFDSGSANIQPQSYGIIRQISQVLLQDETIKLNIIGHTDSDGTDDANLKLSKKRAEAVKQALINIYKISGNRLETDGKGESKPVGDDSTTNGKAQNRRVEFIKI